MGEKRLTDIFAITEENLALRREFIGLGEKQRQLVAELAPWAEKAAPDLARKFYDTQFAFGPTREFFERMAQK